MLGVIIASKRCLLQKEIRQELLNWIQTVQIIPTDFSSTTCLQHQSQLYSAPEMYNNSKYGLHQFRKINTLNTLSRTSRLHPEQEFVPLQQRINDNVFSQASTSGIFDLSFESKENLRFIEEINLFLQ
ncbi:Hypothetical_protein [Hexamita inflata]|uniref:Hypothetical_protein n=1 Tax=Hexamita inflata TaxID=28002 RepID=A0AA86QP57_9EUKA|nr:Hypothetical protein HINF_LOCUS46796 [Hexamita inflata]CAI9959155.1 Hypothetical protein HINF_LOCUS46800 [Hexamita inflata]